MAEFDWEADLYDWESDLDAPLAVPAGGRRGRGGVDLTAQRSQERQAAEARRRDMQPADPYTAGSPTWGGDDSALRGAAKPVMPLVGAAEAAATVGSGMLGTVAGGLAGLGQMATGGADPAAAVERWQDRLTYQPTSQTGQQLLGTVGDAMDYAITQPGQAIGEGILGLTGSPAAATVGQMAWEGLPDLVGLGAASRGARTAARALPEERAGRDAVRRADRQTHDPGLLAAHYGLEVSPNELRGVRPDLDVPAGPRFAETATRSATAESRARANAPRLNRIAAREMGVDETDLLTPEVFQRAKEPHFAVRQEGKRFPQTEASQEFVSDIQRLRSGEWDPDAARTIHEILGRHESLGSSGDLVDRISSLRDQATKRMRSDGQKAYADYEIGTALRQLADAMEEELGRRALAAGDVSYQGRLRESRRQLAKIYSVEDATRADHVDARKLATAAERGVPFTEDLAVLAHLGQRLPQSVAPSPAVGAASAGVDSSAAGIGGAINRFSQNVIRRYLGERSVGNFNTRLQADAAGFDPARFLPEAFRPRYAHPSPMRPNDGPQLPTPPPSAPPGLFADDIPMPRAPAAPDAGRPAPAGPSFNQVLADRLAGDLQLEGQAPRSPAPPAPFSRPLDVVDFEPAQAAPPPGQSLPALTQDQLRLAPEQPLTATDPVSGLPFPEPNSVSAMLDDPVSIRRRTPLGRGIEGDFASQLGPVRAEPGIADFELGNMTPGMPDRPRGVAGPRSAQIGGRTPRGFQLLEDDTPPPLGPRFGPDDEFPPLEGAPATPPTPPGAAGGSVMLQRNVPEGVDPFAPRNRARSLAMFEQGTPEALEGGLYGPVQGVREFPRSDFRDVGDIEGLRQLVAGNPDMTVSDLLVLLSQRSDRPQGVTFTRPPELSGTPREFHRFVE